MAICCGKDGKEPEEPTSLKPEGPTSPKPEEPTSPTVQTQVSRCNIEDLYEFSEEYNLELGHCDNALIFVAKLKASRDNPAQHRAVKKVFKKELRSKENFDNELALMKEFRDPNIIRLYTTYEDPDHVYLLHEFCIGGPLYDCIIKTNDVSEKLVWQVMRQVASPLKYLHSKQVCYRNLMLDNLLIAKSNLSDFQDGSLKNETGCIKLIDFALACYFKKGEKSMTERVGPPHYVAPEICPADAKYNEKCDVWSCGVLMHQLLVGSLPFTGKTEREILHKVRLAKFTLNADVWAKVDRPTKDVLCGFLTFNPDHRPSAEEAFAKIDSVFEAINGNKDAQDTYLKTKPPEKFAKAIDVRVFDLNDRMMPMHTMSEEGKKVFKQTRQTKLLERILGFIRGPNLAKSLDGMFKAVNEESTRSDGSDASLEAMRKSVDKQLRERKIVLNPKIPDSCLKVGTEQEAFRKSLLSEYEDCKNEQRERNLKRALRTAFASFDADDSGSIAEEFKRALSECSNYYEQEISAGRVFKLDEFASVMQKAGGAIEDNPCLDIDANTAGAIEDSPIVELDLL